MDGRPFRAPQTPERRVINGGSDARRPEDPRTARLDSNGGNRGQKPYRIVRQSGWLPRIITILIIVLVVAGLAVAGWLLWSSQHGNPGIDSSKYQSVALTDGQNYFGKLTVVNGEYLKLTNVYYLQQQNSTSNNGSTDSQTSTNNNFTLVKFKDVVYGPEDELIIQKSQVLFYENLDPSGKVAQAIAQANGN